MCVVRLRRSPDSGGGTAAAVVAVNGRRILLATRSRTRTVTAVDDTAVAPPCSNHRFPLPKEVWHPLVNAYEVR